MFDAVDDLGVLTPADGTDVGGDAGVDDYIVGDAVGGGSKATEDEETATALEFFCVVAEDGGEGWEGEGFLVDMTDWFV